MNFKLDSRNLTDALVKLEAACDALPQIAEQVRAEALGHAVIGARRNVYDTPPGHYLRSGEYLRGFQASGRATRNTAAVMVWNDVEYAANVEFGSGPHEMNPAQIQAYAAANPMQAVYLGRSGQKFSLPGPSVIPASVFSLYRMRELFAVRVKRALTDGS